MLIGTVSDSIKLYFLPLPKLTKMYRNAQLQCSNLELKAGFEAQIEELTSKLDGMNLQRRQDTIKIEQLAAELNETKNRRQADITEISRLDGEVERLNAQRDEDNLAIEALQTDLKMEQHTTILQDKKCARLLQALTIEEGNAAIDVETASWRISELQDAIIKQKDDFESRITALSSALNDMTIERDEKDAALKKLQDEYNTLRGDNVKKDQDYATLLEDMTIQKDKAANDAEAASLRISGLQDTMTEQKDHVDSRISELTSSLKAVTDERDQKEAALKELRAEYKTLRGENVQMNQDYAMLADEFEILEEYAAIETAFAGLEIDHLKQSESNAVMELKLTTDLLARAEQALHAVKQQNPQKAETVTVQTPASMDLIKTFQETCQNHQFNPQLLHPVQ